MEEEERTIPLSSPCPLKPPNPQRTIRTWERNAVISTISCWSDVSKPLCFYPIPISIENNSAFILLSI